jgi:hypothetical protein
MEKNFEGLWIIGFGLAGGFGGIRDYMVIEAESEDDAAEIAFEMACEHYEKYEGMYGLRTVDEIMEEDELDEEDAESVYSEERDNWLAYTAVAYSKEYEKKIQGNHYQNDFKDRTD